MVDFRFKFATEIELDVRKYSYDPDLEEIGQDKSELSFKWLCRRDCETFPKYDMTDWDNWLVEEEGTPCDASKYYEEFFDYGCFFDDGHHYPGES